MIEPRDWPRPDGPLPRPIGSIAQYARIIGIDAALALAEARGGTRLYIRNPPLEADHVVATLIGMEPAAKLAEVMGGRMLKIPLGREWRVAIYRSAGCSYADIALLLGVGESTVHRWLQAQDLVHHQLDLFERA